MRHGSLFSGIGGFDLAAEWMGWENIFHCEWKEFGQKILKYYWPNAKNYGDITKTDFSIHRGSIDILTGGFPCQPYSTAGKRKGTEDDRHLWPEMLRAIREIQPRWIVGENVRGLTNWNGGVVFDEVQSDLENEGYEVTPFLLPACAVNAPHRRDRIWFVAHAASNNDKGNKREISGENGGSKFDNVSSFDQPGRGLCNEGVLANAIGIRQQGPPRSLNASSQKAAGNWKASWAYDASRWPTESPVCGGNDGLPGKLVGITFSDFSEESQKGFGNAIVPQVALQIFKAIEQMEKEVA